MYEECNGRESWRRFWAGEYSKYLPIMPFDSEQRNLLARLRQEAAEEQGDATKQLLGERAEEEKKSYANLQAQIDQLYGRYAQIAVQTQFNMLMSLLSCPPPSTGHDYPEGYERTFTGKEYFEALIGCYDISKVIPEDLSAKVTIFDDSDITCTISGKYWIINRRKNCALNVASFGYDYEYEAHKAIFPNLRKINLQNTCSHIRMLFVTTKLGYQREYYISDPSGASHVLVDLEVSHDLLLKIRDLVYPESSNASDAIDSKHALEFLFDGIFGNDFAPKILAKKETIGLDFRLVLELDWSKARLMPELDDIMQSDSNLNQYRHYAVTEFCDRSFKRFLECGNWRDVYTD